MPLKKRRHIVVFCAPAQGHFNRLLPVMADLCKRGITIDFFAHEMACDKITQTGANFINIYEKRDMDIPDSKSMPLPLRNISFAGYWADDIIDEVAALRPDLVLHDSDAVIGRVVAAKLRLPRVVMRSGHYVDPMSSYTEMLARNTYHVAEQCWESVYKLRERHGIPDASPFCYLTDVGADLTILSEPPEFSPASLRTLCGPVAFYGSCWPEGGYASSDSVNLFGADSGALLRVYAGFGTVAWMQNAERMMRVLTVIADAMAADSDVRGIISLGNRRASAGELQQLRRPNVCVESYIDQVKVLQHASVFITHNGLNSTHEAIFHGVPMVSHPFNYEQHDLATLCLGLGIAIPLVEEPLTMSDVSRALNTVRSEDATLRARLAQARAWEENVVQRRPAVIDRIIALMH